MDTLYIVMPAYNEEDNIRNVVRQWYPVLDGKSENSRLVIADSGSTDKTHGILTSLQQNGYPKLEILSDTGQFHGPKVMALYNYAVHHGADYVFQTDSDGQTDPDEFDAFWQERSRYDGIFGNRTARGDGKFRAFAEKVVCVLLKMYFGVTVPDANAPFRLMKTDVLKKYLYMLPADYDLPNIMITAYFVYYKERTSFKEISFQARSAGVNSVNVSKIIRTGWKALGDFRRLKKEMKDGK